MERKRAHQDCKRLHPDPPAPEEEEEEEDESPKATNIILSLCKREITGYICRRETRNNHFYKNMSLLLQRSVTYTSGLMNFGQVLQVLFNKSGKRYITLGSMGSVKVWNANKSSLIGEIDEAYGATSNMALSDDDRILCTVSGPTLCMWSFKTLELMKRYIYTFEDPPYEVSNVFFMKKSSLNYVAIVVGVSVVFVHYSIDSNSCEPINFSVPVVITSSYVTSPKFAETGKWPHTYTEAKLSPCGKFLLVVHRHVCIYTLNEDGPVCTLDDPFHYMHCVTLTPHIRATWAIDSSAFVITTYESGCFGMGTMLNDGVHFKFHDTILWEFARSLSFNSTNEYLVTGHDRYLLRLYLHRLEDVYNYDIPTGALVNNIACHPIDPDIIATTELSSCLTIWDFSGGDESVIFQTAHDRIHITCCVWSPDGDTLIIGDRLGFIMVYTCKLPKVEL